MSITITPKDTILTFEVDVSGSDEIPKPRLVIPISEKVSLFFEGSIADSKVEVDISELLKLTDSTEFQGKLEVVIEAEDAIFVPWEDSIIIEKPLEVKAKTIKTPVKESKVTVTAKSETVSKVKTKAPIMEIKKKSVQEMFDENF